MDLLYTITKWLCYNRTERSALVADSGWFHQPLNFVNQYFITLSISYFKASLFVNSHPERITLNFIYLCHEVERNSLTIKLQIHAILDQLWTIMVLSLIYGAVV